VSARIAVEAMEDRTLLSGYPYQVWSFPLPLGQVTQMVAGTDGAVWAITAQRSHTDTQGNTIIDSPPELCRITPDGALTVTGDPVPSAMAAGTDGKLWIIVPTGPSTQSLEYIAPGGGVSGVPGVHVTSASALAVSPDNNVFFETLVGTSAELGRYDPSSGQVSAFSIDPLTSFYALVAGGQFNSIDVIGSGPFSQQFLAYNWIAGVDETTGEIIGSSDVPPGITGGAPVDDLGVWLSSTVVFTTETGYRAIETTDASGSVGTIGVDVKTAHVNVLPGVVPDKTTGLSFDPNGGAAGGSDGYAYVGAPGVGVNNFGPAGVAAIDPSSQDNEGDTHADAVFALNSFNVVVAVVQGGDNAIWFAATANNTYDPQGNLIINPSVYGRIPIEQAQVKVTTDATGPVDPGETVHFTLDATAGPDSPDALTLTDAVPTGMAIVPGSVTTNGFVVDPGLDGTVKAQVLGLNRIHMEYDATVDPLDQLPLGATALTDSAEIDAHFPDGRTVHGQGDSPVPLAQPNLLQVTLVPTTPVPGLVSPGQTISYYVKAQAPPGATYTQVGFSTPAGTTLYLNGKQISSFNFSSNSDSVDNSTLFGTNVVTAVVAAASQLPAGQTTVVTTAHGEATLADGSMVSKDVTFTLKIASLVATGQKVVGLEGGPTINPTVATFISTIPNAPASSFTATIDWGDQGPTSKGKIAVLSGGGFVVNAVHTYAKKGHYPVMVTIVANTGESVTAQSSADIYAKYTVNSTADLGDSDLSDGIPWTGRTLANGLPEVTLRAAIEQANVDGGAVIDFNIALPAGTSYPTITPDFPATAGAGEHASEPALIAPITIDGSTQPGSGFVALDGSGSQMLRASAGDIASQTLYDGLTITGGDSTIKGLYVWGFTGWDILMRDTGGDSLLSDFVGVAPGTSGNGGPGLGTVYRYLPSVATQPVVSLALGPVMSDDPAGTEAAGATLASAGGSSAAAVTAPVRLPNSSASGASTTTPAGPVPLLAGSDLRVPDAPSPAVTHHRRPHAAFRPARRGDAVWLRIPDWYSLVREQAGAGGAIVTN